MSQPIDTLPPPERLRPMDVLCDAFEVSWKEGKRPRIEELLDKVAEDARPILLAELIRTELEWRCRLGEEPSGEEYRTRFPSCGADLGDWLAEARGSAEQMSVLSSCETASFGSSGPAGDACTPDGNKREAPARGPVPLLARRANSGAPVRLGEYDLLERLGAGGMGEVYKARHRRLDKLVAVKLLGGHLQDSGMGVARFLREMKAAGALEHPNVVEALDAGEQDGVVFLVMKLIAGSDLARLVRERGPLPITEACAAARQAATGLHYLHEHGLIHRDIKASNLMRTPDGTVKILDLGLVRWRDGVPVSEELTLSGAVMGTPDFLAPEQVGAGGRVDVGADLYGLGATLFYLLTGQAPFAHRGGLDAKLRAHQTEEAPDVRTLRPEVPAALADLVRRLLAKDPRKRPASAAAVAAELAPFASASPWSGSTDANPLSAPSARGKRWLPWVTGASAAAVVLAVLSGALDYSRPKKSEPDLPAAVTALRVDSLEITHYANVPGGFDQPRGVLGRDSFATLLDDSVMVAARLSRPAYAYLIAYRPDGTEELCFPESDDKPPPLDDKPRYPSVSRGVNYGLNEGTGLEVFAVVASSEPLPAYKVWRSRRGTSPWMHAETPAGIVWWDDGETVEALTIDAPFSQRGKGKKVAGKTPLAELTDWLRQASEVETAAGMGFAVLPNGKR